MSHEGAGSQNRPIPANDVAGCRTRSPGQRRPSVRSGRPCRYRTLSLWPRSRRLSSRKLGGVPCSCGQRRLPVQASGGEKTSSPGLRASGRRVRGSLRVACSGTGGPSRACCSSTGSQEIRAAADELGRSFSDRVCWVRRGFRGRACASMANCASNVLRYGSLPDRPSWAVGAILDTACAPPSLFRSPVARGRLSPAAARLGNGRAAKAFRVSRRVLLEIQRSRSPPRQRNYYEDRERLFADVDDVQREARALVRAVTDLSSLVAGSKQAFDETGIHGHDCQRIALAAAALAASLTVMRRRVDAMYSGLLE